MKKRIRPFILCYINGNLVDADHMSIPVTDLAFQRGICAFDCIRFYNTKPLFLEKHMERLKNSAISMGIQINDSIIQSILDSINHSKEFFIYPDKKNNMANIYITGGDDISEDGIFPNPRIIVLFQEGPSYTKTDYKLGRRLSLINYLRPFPNIKDTNYSVGLSNLIKNPYVIECLYHFDGKISEAFGSSFFIYKDNKIITIPDEYVLPGITRNILIDIIKENNIILEKREIFIEELKDIDEAFITSTFKEVIPIKRIGDIEISRRVGKMAKKLLILYRKKVKEYFNK